MRINRFVLATALLTISGTAGAQVTPAPTLGPGAAGVSLAAPASPGAGVPTAPGAIAPLGISPTAPGRPSSLPTSRGPGLVTGTNQGGTSVMIPGSPVNGWSPAGSGMTMVPGQVPQGVIQPK